ncbi:MAG TPA: hypothetical protein VIZ18_05010 [Ktedonobacteraceae bacterium]
MHLTYRSKTRLLLSMIALLGIVGAMLVMAVTSRTTYAASLSAQFNGTSGTAVRLSTSRPSLTNPTNAGGKRMIDTHLPARPSNGAAMLNSSRVSSTALVKAEGSLLHNFDGLSDVNQTAVNGGTGVGEVTPPDQGLCVGFDPGVPGTKVVFQAINSALRETSVNNGPLPGAPLLGNKDVSFANFWEPGAFSDPRCFFDPSTSTFFFTVIGTLQAGPDKGNTSIDIAVFNSSGFAVYQVDSSFGGTQFGDQPHVGYDNNALYASTDQFNVPGTAYFGASLFVISKSQLVATVPAPALLSFGPLSLAGIPILTLQPAVSTTPTSTEYLLNSFPFADALITPNPITQQLGFWSVTHDSGVSNGHPGNVTLTGTIIHSETYGFPVPAVSTGTGLTDKNGVTSEAALNPDDSRLQQVQFINGHLWSALTTAISINNDPAARDAVAWFNVDAAAGKVATQGYIASQGNYLIYPAILRTTEGTTAIVFTITSATINPSAAYVVRASTSAHFGVIHIAASGFGPHLSFSDTLPVVGRPRWGDYSAAVLDPNGHDIWLATEYIPSPANQDPFDNWGTRVFDTQGDV